LHELMALPPDAFAHVRDLGEHEGAPYVVTDAHFGETSLAEWLKRARASESPAPPVPSKAQDPPIGEFTRLFQARKITLPGPWVPPPPSRTPQYQALLPVPGEFTRLFSSPFAAEPATLAPEQNAGELTALFRDPPELLLAQAQQVPPSVPAPVARPIQASAQKVGDFTRLLKPAAPTADLLPETPAPPMVAAPGEYTRIVMERPSSPAAPAIPEAPPPRPAVRRNLPLIIVSSIAAVLALVLILFALLRR
jgi:hypothetical protein